jgi:hypothetical protein
MYRAMLFTVAVGVVAGGLTAADDDPIRQKLDAAKSAYDKEMARHHKAVVDWFEMREDAARRAGDKKALDQIKAERKVYDQQGELPASAPRQLTAQAETARKNLDAAYEQAIKDYTRAKKDTEAAEVEAEYQLFRFAATPLGRTVGRNVTRITNRNSERVIAVADGSKADGSPIIQFGYSGGADQKWKLVLAPDDHFLIQNDQSGTYLSKPVKDDKAVVLNRLYAAAEARHQQWKITPVKGEPDWYLIQNRASGKYLSVDFGSKDNAARMIQFKLNGPNGSADQHWKFERIE